jgi:hypothetical protein
MIPPDDRKRPDSTRRSVASLQDTVPVTLAHRDGGRLWGNTLIFGAAPSTGQRADAVDERLRAR